jgi:DNA-binding MarR family transcriptional regulator
MATAIHTVKPGSIATFLGRKPDPRYEGEAGNSYHVRIEGTRIKHSMGSCSIKMYDKFSKILRVETTVNDISFLNIEFISAFDSRVAGRKKLESIGRPAMENNRKYKGFNFFSDDDPAILHGEFNIGGFRNKNMKLLLKMNAAKVSRLIKRLRVHGLIKKVASSYDQKADELSNTLLGNYSEHSRQVQEITGSNISLFSRIQNAINEFLQWLKANVFGSTDAKLNEFVRKMLSELLSGKNIMESKAGKKDNSLILPNYN